MVKLLSNIENNILNVDTFLIIYNSLRIKDAPYVRQPKLLGRK